MDQLGVVTIVLVLSTLLTSIEDIRKFLRKRSGKTDGGMMTVQKRAATAPSPAASVSDSQAQQPAESAQPDDLMAAMMADLESDDERRVSRAMALVDKVPQARLSPALVQMLRHPREEISTRAARALLQLGSAETIEPLYLYFNSRASRA